MNCFSAVAGPTRQCVGFDPTKKQIQSFKEYLAYDDVTRLRIGFPNWYVDAAHVEVPTGSDAFISASVEYPPGSHQQIDFDGSETGVIADGVTLFEDISIDIPRGASFCVWAFFRSAAGVIYSNAIGDMVQGRSGSEMSVSGLVDKTSCGGSLSLVGPVYAPIIIMAKTSESSAAVMGDSRSWGHGDVNDGGLDHGNIQRSLSPSLPVVNLSLNGDRSDHWLNGHSRRKEIADLCGSIVLELGVNDIRAGKAAQQVKESNEAIIALFDDKPVFPCTLEPMSSSTGDSWATLANQKPLSFQAQRVAYNDMVRAGLNGSAGFFEVADAVESSRNSGKWRSNGTPFGYTIDGLHANDAGYSLIKDGGAVDPQLILLGPDDGLATIKQAQRGLSKTLLMTPHAAHGETGRFSPCIVGTSVRGAAQYTISDGMYRKVGNQVFFTLAVDWSLHTGAGGLDVDMNDIPFSQYSAFEFSQVYPVLGSNLSYAEGRNLIAGSVNTGGTGKRIRLYQSGPGSAGVDRVQISPAGFVAISGSFFTGD
jgi:hypothetical protein